jgi:hypothetical protein
MIYRTTAAFGGFARAIGGRLRSPLRAAAVFAQHIDIAVQPEAHSAVSGGGFFNSLLISLHLREMTVQPRCPRVVQSRDEKWEVDADAV